MVTLKEYFQTKTILLKGTKNNIFGVTTTTYVFLTVYVFIIFSSIGICYLASHSSSLVELDLSGCMSITNKSLEALQENLLFAREKKIHLNFLIGGSHTRAIFCLVAVSPTITCLYAIDSFTYLPTYLVLSAFGMEM